MINLRTVFKSIVCPEARLLFTLSIPKNEVLDILRNNVKPANSMHVPSERFQGSVYEDSFDLWPNFAFIEEGAPRVYGAMIDADGQTNIEICIRWPKLAQVFLVGFPIVLVFVAIAAFLNGYSAIGSFVLFVFVFALWILLDCHRSLRRTKKFTILLFEKFFGSNLAVSTVSKPSSG